MYQPSRPSFSVDNSYSATHKGSKGTNSYLFELYQAGGNSTTHKAGIIEHKKGMDKKGSEEKKKEQHPVSCPPPTSKCFRQLLCLLPFQIHILLLQSLILSFESPIFLPFSLSNVAGALTSSQYAVPKGTARQKKISLKRGTTLFLHRCKSSKHYVNITDDMVRTLYKKIIGNVYRRKLQDSIQNRNISAEPGRIAFLKHKLKGITIQE